MDTLPRIAVVGSAFALMLMATSTDETGEWCLSGKEQSQIRWTAEAGKVHLSPFQRLAARFTIRLDGKEVVGRAGARHLVAWVVLRDASGHTFATHDDLDLARHLEAASGSQLEWSIDAFVRPGNYDLTLAVVEPSTRKYSLKRERFHVASLKNDPLPELWTDLPPVEFVTASDELDRWFLPAVDARLRLPAGKQAARVEVVVNTSVTEETKVPRMLYNQAMKAMLPLLKILARAAPPNGSLNVTSLDLWRRRVEFEQSGVRELDWPRFKAVLAQSDPGKIGAEDLKTEARTAQFFADEVVRRLSDPAPARIAIVLSPAVGFRSEQAVTPIQLPPDPNLRVFYFRIAGTETPPPDVPVLEIGVQDDRLPMQARGGRGLPGPPRVASATAGTIVDDRLAQVLNPLHPRLFDIATPENARKALAETLHSIEALRSP